MAQAIDLVEVFVHEGADHPRVVGLPSRKERRKQRANFARHVQRLLHAATFPGVAEFTESASHSVPVEGLGQHPVEPKPHALLASGEARVPGDRHDRDSGRPQPCFTGTNLSDEHEACDHRHLEVRQKCIEAVFSHASESLSPAARLRNLVPPARKNLDKEETRGVVVIGKQQLWSRPKHPSDRIVPPPANLSHAEVQLGTRASRPNAGTVRMPAAWIRRARMPCAAPRIHVVDDDPEIRLLLGAWLASAGYAVEGFGSGQAYLDYEGPHPSLVCLDLNMPAPDGLAVLRTLRARGLPCKIVVFTADDAVNTAVECMKQGAFDFVVKPIHKTGFLPVVEAALRPALVLAPPDRTRAEVPSFIGKSSVMQTVRTEIGKVADTDITVFIHGESGTGKELVARSIHACSGRAEGPFVALNCGAIPEALQESVLFGHEKGAFTGATQTRKGKFQLADGGTLLLDEVAELSPAAQVRLLRVLQERTVEPVGASQPLPINVRVLSATHRDLERMVIAHEFRQDLYYRLMIYPIEVPALRAHPDDIRALFEHFLEHHASTMGFAIPTIEDDVWPALRRHPWPGNVRELANVAHRSVVAHRGGTLSAATLGLRTVADATPEPELEVPDSPDPPTGNTMADAERRALVEAVDACSGNLTAAARRLGIGRATLYRKLTRHGLTRES